MEKALHYTQQKPISANSGLQNDPDFLVILSIPVRWEQE